jgi:hypothetical protein
MHTLTTGPQMATFLRQLAGKLDTLGPQQLRPTLTALRLQVTGSDDPRAVYATAHALAGALGLTGKVVQLGSGSWYYDAGDGLQAAEVYGVVATAADITAGHEAASARTALAVAV